MRIFTSFTGLGYCTDLANGIKAFKCLKSQADARIRARRKEPSCDKKSKTRKMNTATLVAKSMNINLQAPIANLE